MPLWVNGIIGDNECMQLLQSSEVLSLKIKKNTTKFKKDKESKNKEEIEVIHGRESGNIRLLRLDKAVQVSTKWQLEEELTMLTSAFIEKGKLTFTGYSSLIYSKSN